MKKIFLMFLTVVLFSASAAMAGDFPTSLAGFTLGADINKYSECCDTNRSMPVSDIPFLSEVLIIPGSLPGVRGGSLSYANCKDKGKIVRIKLKFYDRSKDLFEKLLERYKDRFGDPDKYLGDAFKNVIAWEWFFTNDKDERVSVILMWSRDKEMRPGVSIKMTHVTLLESEYQCYKSMDVGGKGKGKQSKVRTLDTYVPR